MSNIDKEFRHLIPRWGCNCATCRSDEALDSFLSAAPRGWYPAKVKELEAKIEDLQNAISVLNGCRLDDKEEIDTLRGVLEVAAESCERDRREPDKILCHVATMRRSLL